MRHARQFFVAKKVRELFSKKIQCPYDHMMTKIKGSPVIATLTADIAEGVLDDVTTS